MIREFETTVADLLAGLTAENHAKAVEIATLAHRIRGFSMLKRFVAGDQINRRQRLFQMIIEARRRQPHIQS